MDEMMRLEVRRKPGIRMIEGKGWKLVAPNKQYFPAVLRRRFSVGKESIAVFQIWAGERSPGLKATRTRRSREAAQAKKAKRKNA